MLKNNDARTPGRPPKEADQKNRILLEAAKAITSVGYEQCNLQDIANEIDDNASNFNLSNNLRRFQRASKPIKIVFHIDCVFPQKNHGMNIFRLHGGYSAKLKDLYAADK